MKIDAKTGKLYVEKLTKEEHALLRRHCIGFNRWDKFIIKISMKFMAGMCELKPISVRSKWIE